MATRKQTKAKQNLFKQIWKLHSAIFKWLIQWFLRSLLVLSRRVRLAKAGFVLPTTVMLLLVMTIVIGALIVRTSSRTNQVFAERQENYISNAASPAIDRAKSKLEYLFSNPNSNIPNGVPGQTVLVSLMKPPTDTTQPDVYKLGDETRLDLDNDGQADNAWSFPADTNGDGQNDATVAYSIIGQVPTNQNDLNDQSSTALSNRASNLLTRNGPVFNPANLVSSPNCPTGQIQEEGWFIANNNTSVLRKNFQINAVVIPTNTTTASSKPYSTLELQQDRQLDRGNKWGAWFRYDVSLNNPPPFNWNGAMHTEGSIFIGGLGNFTSYLLSAPKSCSFSRTASEITVSEIRDSQNQIQFQGQVLSGSVIDNTMTTDTNRIHSVDQNNNVVSSGNAINFTQNNDSVASTSSVLPADIALDPIDLFTQEISHATTNVTNWSALRDSNWQNQPFVTNRRVYNQQEPKPYLDDTYRADDRYGPKPSYGSNPSLQIPAGTKVGDSIPSGKPELTSKDPMGGGQENLGLDGYWERRARLEGLRTIVGQRLELGSPLGLPTISTITHQARQRRALRDNLAAVQATAIYHQANKDAAGNVQDFPIACLATTVHPGTADTLKRSATFEEITFKDSSGNDLKLSNDFFSGRGTNGWEYDVPDATSFPNPAMLRALNNLANFAGDPFGAFPAQQDNSSSKAVAAAGSVIHPYPQLTQYGDFSNLRRAIRNLNASGYANLSIADQSYLHTAACSLGMLANNIKLLQDFDYSRNAGVLWTNTSTNLNTAISNLSPSLYNTPEMVITALSSDWQRLARTVYLKEQIELERNIYGYNINTGVSNYTCTANKFNSANPAVVSQLARLCPIKAGASYTINDVKYPALYYIFPATKHDEYQTARTGDNYIKDALVNAPTPGTNFYKPIDGNTGATYNLTSDATALESIRLRPRTIGGTNPWKLPTTVVSSPGTAAPNNNQNSLIKYRNASGTESVYQVPFKDAALFNGREMMNVRVLDIDLDLLRQNTLTVNSVTDNWLPQKSIVYAFREDAVREDGIARPAATTWASCDTTTEITTTASCFMNANTPQDPPINSTNGISTKPVDFYADPDRRPYGFRLKDGADLTRSGLPLNDPNNSRGLSLISDNPVYIQGNFNFHSTDGSANNLEEFTETLNTTTYSNFYTRSTPDTRFAKPGGDRWRPSEIIADAVSILSNNFCDGSIEDSFTTAGPFSNSTTVPSGTFAQYGCSSSTGQTSYLNQNRPITLPSGGWLRENPSDLQSPIQVNANGSPVINSGTPYSELDASYHPFYNSNNKKPLNTAVQTTVNTIIISGTVPSRANQFNGGLHNFPRFLEIWTNVPLRITGALVQLNFSTSAAAPFDQDAWEPGNTPSSTITSYEYYNPPNRLWGYDVALQMAPAGPVARRFVSGNTTRNEYYRELPVDDPYIRNLRCAKTVGSSTRIDTSASCS